MISFLRALDFTAFLTLVISHAPFSEKDFLAPVWKNSLDGSNTNRIDNRFFPETSFPLTGLSCQQVTLVALGSHDFSGSGELEPLCSATMTFYLGHASVSFPVFATLLTYQDKRVIYESSDRLSS
jgi:hypothetical protein